MRRLLWRRPAVGLWVRALVYVVIVGGGWLVILPACILFAESGIATPSYRPFPAALVVGGAAFTLGFALACCAGYFLIQYGQGTPLPLDPPRRLVVCGPYHWIRNPQGIGMVLMVLGQVIVIQSQLLWCLLPITLVYLQVAGRWEERQMTRDFGSEYAAYVHRTRKWLPLRVNTDTHPNMLCSHSTSRSS
ncbi:MAG: isoprenylcysteine carboxylmethyltransferase family protein [Planctomycetes bacterium]|nr:isoprenylcysteine carboxylmethyltransferase family protein [Planctomycetota bacterium]